MTHPTPIPADRYNAHPGINKSAICAARIDDDTISMAHMRAQMTRDHDDNLDATPAMRWGTLAHAVLLEPVTFAGRIAVWSETKRGKDWEAFKTAHADKWIVGRLELDKLDAMRKALQADNTARGLIGRIQAAEQGFEWTDPLYGLAKAKPDGCGDNILIEYKTVRSISRRWFQSDAKRRGYHIGAAWYWHGYGEPNQVIFIVQEKAAPFCCACYDIPAGVLTPAYDEAAKIAAQYRICCGLDEGRGVFSGPYQGLQTFELPQWGGGDVETDVSTGTMEGGDL